MRVKFQTYIEECKSIELCRKENGYDPSKELKVTTFDCSVGYIQCIDEQEAEDLYNKMYIDGYINVSNRFCDWKNE